MKEYIMSIMVVSLLGSVILSLSPRSGSGSTLRFLCGLCAVCTVTMPVISLFKGGNVLSDSVGDIFVAENVNYGFYDEIYNEAFKNADALNVETTLKNRISQEFNAGYEDFDLNFVLSQNSDEKYTNTIELLIYPSGMYIDPHSVENYIKEIFDCEFTTIYYCDEKS